MVGHADDDSAPGIPVLGGLSDVSAGCAAYEIDPVIIGFPSTGDTVVLQALRQLQSQVPVSETPRYFELHNWRSEAEELRGLTLMHLPAASLGPSARIQKRLIDIALATCALTVASPVLLIIALAIALDSHGPAIFRHERIGRDGKAFRICKFRSMTADAWQRRDTVAQLNGVDGPQFKMETIRGSPGSARSSARPASNSCRN